MLLSIRKVFSNLKIALFTLGIGMIFLNLQLFYISDYSKRLSNLKNQHLLIDKIIYVDLNDPKMASITISGVVSEITLSVKHVGDKGVFASLNSTKEQQSTLFHSLEKSSSTFCNQALKWSKSLDTPDQITLHTQMMDARAPFITDINRLTDYQIKHLNDAITTTKFTALSLFFIGLGVFLLYRNRLNHIFCDIHQVCAIDTDGTPKTVRTQEIDFIQKRLLRRSTQTSAGQSMVHMLSGLNNQKGLITSFNAKKSSRGSNTVFLALFEIDQYTALIKPLSQEEIGNIFKKLGDIISMYEQPLDIIAHLDDDRIVFIMSRSTKETSLDDCEKILHTVESSGFSTANGIIKITLSGGFLLKIPVKSVEDAINDALKLSEKAKENGGNRIAQLRERSDTYQ